MENRVLSFFKPTILALVAFLVFVASHQFLSRGSETESTGLNVERATAPTIQFDQTQPPPFSHHPSPGLAPVDVVNIQLSSLNQGNRVEGIARCFRFASPANQELTGPAERFGRMVEAPPYSILFEADDTILGAPIYLDDGRIQIVVTVIASQEAHSFVWTLAKQWEKPFRDCWMTDSVVAIAKSRNDVSIDV